MRPDRNGRLQRLFLPVVMLAALSHFGGCVHRGATPKGFESSPTTSSLLGDALEPRRLAIVIGLNEYDDPTYSRLRFATRDAAEVARTLRNDSQGDFDRVVVLTSPEDTSRKAILEELRRLRNDLRRQDTLLVYFSGHGSLEVAPDGTPRLYLVTQDARAADLEATAVNVQLLRRFLTELKAQRKVLVLDNCFSGDGKSRVSATTRSRLAEARDPWSTIERTAGQSEAVLMASTLGGNQPSRRPTMPGPGSSR